MSKSLTHYHKVQSLHSVRLLQTSPWGGKSPKLKGCRAKGKTYERTVARLLARSLDSSAELFYNQWIAFTDSTGSHYCQPDLYIVLPSYVLLLEVKLTQTESAEGQMSELYKPVLEALYSRPVVMVQICKNLRYPPRAEISALHQACSSTRFYTYHCLGDLINV